MALTAIDDSDSESEFKNEVKNDFIYDLPVLERCGTNGKFIRQVSTSLKYEVRAE